MADVKITALGVLTAADPINDAIPIVDVSDNSMAASGTTKRISVNNILGASGTATLASATISGDLTVASSILKVTGGNVGINTATPTNTAGYKTLEIVGTGVNTGGMIRMKSSDASVSSYDFVDNNGRGIFAVSNHNLRFGCNDIEQYRIQPLGIFTWYDGAGGTRMTLNSTGLGVGVTPSTAWNTGGNLQVGVFAGLYTNSSLGAVDLTSNSIRTGSDTYQYLSASSNNATRFQQRDGSFRWFNAPVGTSPNAITFTQAMTLDASGNLLVGTTSAGGSASNSAKSVAGFFSTVNGSTASTASGAAVTMFASPTEATFIVSAYIFGTGAPATYNAVAIVKVSGSTATVTTISSSTNMTISVSGLNVQATQTSGSAQVVVYSAIRIS
jgi:hypothetical protein